MADVKTASKSENPQKQYWLIKSEPDSYSIDDLKRDKKTLWEGVRNYQARNFMMHGMRVGDEVLFYHSNAEPPGIAGTAVVSALAVPDPSAQNAKSQYFEPKASVEKPIWYCTEVRFQRKFSQLISLEKLRNRRELSEMLLLKKGTRLSVFPVTPSEFKAVCQMADQVGR